MKTPSITDYGIFDNTNSLSGTNLFDKTVSLPYVKIKDCGDFSVHKTFDCGQAFRFDPIKLSPELLAQSDDSGQEIYGGTALGKTVAFSGNSSGALTIYNSTPEDFCEIWRGYLGLDEDYNEINRSIIDSEAFLSESGRQTMAEAVKAGRGIRILRQDPFECLISFIVSQNNNIPRIKKIIDALCRTYGENGRFPTPEALVSAGVDGLFSLRTGFRAAYIYDAALRVQNGDVNLQKIMDSGDFDYCTAELCKIKGVGPKVSACALLFGFHKLEAFPIDVWMKKSIAAHFPEGLDCKKLGPYAGIAQQYLFYYERYHGGNPNADQLNSD